MAFLLMLAQQHCILNLWHNSHIKHNHIMSPLWTNYSNKSMTQTWKLAGRQQANGNGKRHDRNGAHTTNNTQKAALQIHAKDQTINSVAI